MPRLSRRQPSQPDQLSQPHPLSRRGGGEFQTGFATRKKWEAQNAPNPNKRNEIDTVSKLNRMIAQIKNKPQLTDDDHNMLIQLHDRLESLHPYGVVASVEKKLSKRAQVSLQSEDPQVGSREQDIEDWLESCSEDVDLTKWQIAPEEHLEAELAAKAGISYGADTDITRRREVGKRVWQIMGPKCTVVFLDIGNGWAVELTEKGKPEAEPSYSRIIY